MKYIGIGIFTLLVITGFIFVAMYFSYTNKEVVLRTAVEAKQKDAAVIYDQSWKIVKKQAQVADKYESAFKKAYVDIMEARYDTDSSGKARGQLFNFVTEANPNFDIRLYEKLANSIEEQQVVFTQVQEELIDKWQAHKILINQQPGKFFLQTIGGVEEIKIKLVTSTKTEKAFETGKDDDTSVF